MSLLRSNFALNIQAIQSGVWQTMKFDKIDNPEAPKFRLQFFSEATNPRYRIAMNAARQKSSPFYGVTDGNAALWNDFIKDCLIEFGIKDWDGITRIDLMSDKEISDRTLAFIRENIDPIISDDNHMDTTKYGLPSIFLERKYLAKNDDILKSDGRAIYYSELIYELADTYSLSDDVVNQLIKKAEEFFEGKVQCTQKNIRDFLNEPRNALAFRFCGDSVFADRPYRSSLLTGKSDV